MGRAKNIHLGREEGGNCALKAIGSLWWMDILLLTEEGEANTEKHATA